MQDEERLPKVRGKHSALMFNAAVAGAALSAASEIGFLDLLDRQSVIRILDFCRAHRLNQMGFEAMLTALAAFEIVHIDRNLGEVRQGIHYSEYRAESGLFEWLFRGTGNLLTDLVDALQADASAESGRFQRDGKRVARASAACSHFIDPYFEGLLNEFPVRKVIDLGCGAAYRLIYLAEKYGISGVGVDINAQAVAHAREAVRLRHMQDRIEILQDDVCRLTPHPAYAQADMITMFFMGHDLWPEKQCQCAFLHLRKVLPEISLFFMVDTVRSENAVTPETPTFTLGFEIAHAVMGKLIPTLSQWLAIFPPAGWQCLNTYPVGIPQSYIFHLAPRAS